MLSNFQNKKNKKTKRRENQYIVFSLTDEQFGVNVKQAKEIIPVNQFTHIPNSPDYVMGVIDLRGEIIPIIDLKKKLGLSVNNLETENQKIIIVEINNSFIGMLVDNVNEMLRMYEDEIAKAPNITKGINKNYITGVGRMNNELLILLDLDKILSEEEMLELDNMDIS